VSVNLSRREWLASAGAALSADVAATAAAANDRAKEEPFVYCLNTSTIREQKLKIVEVVELAAREGYQALEPWVTNLDQYVKDGGNLKDLSKRLADRGLAVPSVIGFAEWIVEDDEQRKKGLEQARREMDMVQQIGGKRIAAPPAGATKQAVNLLKAAERYRALLEIGDKIGVVPQVEVWGFSQSLSRLGEALLVALESGHPKACVLPDVYHLYKGGSGFNGLKLLGAATMHVFHFNDYPASPTRADIRDAHRVYPGDGVAPLKDLLRDLRDIGFRGALSLELFNPEYWKQDALQVARTGLEKMKAVVKSSLA